MLRQGDVILVPVPFTDLTSLKRRPALIISTNTYNESHEDIVVVAMTSNIEPRDFSIIIDTGDMARGELKAKSMIRADKIYTLNKSIVLKTFGGVKPEVMLKIKNTILGLIEMEIQ